MNKNHLYCHTSGSAISCTTHAVFKPLLADFSVVVWVKLISSNIVDSTIITCTTGGTYWAIKIGGSSKENKIIFTYYDNAAAPFELTGVTAIGDNKWHMITCAADRNGNSQIFIDDNPTPDSEVASTNAGSIGPTGSLVFSSMNTGPPIVAGEDVNFGSFAFLNGIALTPAQIDYVYNYGAFDETMFSLLSAADAWFTNIDEGVGTTASATVIVASSGSALDATVDVAKSDWRKSGSRRDDLFIQEPTGYNIYNEKLLMNNSTVYTATTVVDSSALPGTATVLVGDIVKCENGEWGIVSSMTDADANNRITVDDWYGGTPSNGEWCKVYKLISSGNKSVLCDSTERPDALYAWLKNSARDALMGAETATNPRTLLLQPGVWELTEKWVLDTNYIHVAALLAIPQLCIVEGSPTTATIEQTCNIVYLSGFRINNDYAGIGNSFWINPDSDNDDSVYMNMDFRRGGSESSQRQPCASSGDYGGTWINCTGGRYAFRLGGTGNFTPTMINCSGDDFSFAGDANMDVSTMGGYYQNCRCVDSSGALAASGFAGCGTKGVSITSAAMFINCISGGLSFAIGNTCAGTFIGCQGGDDCFGSNTNGDGIFSGFAQNCIAGTGSFGKWDGGGPTQVTQRTGTLVDCIEGADKKTRSNRIQNVYGGSTFREFHGIVDGRF